MPQFSDYNGDNADLFKQGVDIIVEKALDRIFENNQSFVLDDVLTDLNVVCQAINRSVNKGRKVLIIFVEQEAELAWNYLKSSGYEAQAENFVEEYLNIQETVGQIKASYQDKIMLDLVIVGNEVGSQQVFTNISMTWSTPSDTQLSNFL